MHGYAAEQYRIEKEEKAMRTLPAQTFTSVTEEKFAALEQKAATAVGIAISGNEGEGEQHGIKIAWAYDPHTMQLTIQCVDHPWFVSESLIQSKITGLVEG